MRILIVEDEYSLADAIAEILKNEKFNVDIVTDGENGEFEALTGIYDLIILDVMLPGKNGYEILKNLRKENIKTPVIMLTAKSELENKLEGLENGADDYITKPFHMKELIARIKVILKRSTDVQEIEYLEFEDLKLDLTSCKLECNGNSVVINGKELELMQLLLLNKNQVLSRETAANKIWGYYDESEYNNVEVYVSFIRRKLKILKSKVKIKAIRGIGYKMEVEND